MRTPAALPLTALPRRSLLLPQLLHSEHLLLQLLHLQLARVWLRNSPLGKSGHPWMFSHVDFAVPATLTVAVSLSVTVAAPAAAALALSPSALAFTVAVAKRATTKHRRDDGIRGHKLAARTGCNHDDAKPRRATM